MKMRDWNESLSCLQSVGNDVLRVSPSQKMWWTNCSLAAEFGDVTACDSWGSLEKNWAWPATHSSKSLWPCDRACIPTWHSGPCTCHRRETFHHHYVGNLAGLEALLGTSTLNLKIWNNKPTPFNLEKMQKTSIVWIPKPFEATCALEVWVQQCNSHVLRWQFW